MKIKMGDWIDADIDGEGLAVFLVIMAVIIGSVIISLVTILK